MASLAEFPEAVEGWSLWGDLTVVHQQDLRPPPEDEALFGQRELAADGRCQVKLFDGHCRSVALSVDEFIPCHPRHWWDDEGLPLFARCNGNEAWVLLLEKAFAKMLGSYTALSGGNCCSAFRAFTGEASYVWARSEGEMARVEGEWKKMQLAEGEDFFVWQPGSEDRRDAESLWDEVRSADAQSFLVACSMRAKHGQEHVREDGLVEAHAYSLLQAVDVEGQRLVFLRNPWGNDKRWNGRWCDGDEAWDRFPSLRKRLRPRFRSDGAFWMAWVDFQASFDFVFVCPKTMRSTAAATEHRRRSEMGEAERPEGKFGQALPERLPRLPPGARGVAERGGTGFMKAVAENKGCMRWKESLEVRKYTLFRKWYQNPADRETTSSDP
ncbi:Calpain-type cysteine protease ADL1 (Phytocalpain ADL1) (Protein ADAXIALIZED LEAF1) (Protein DEFECTIVE KERNEL 1) (OsDEK1) (Protein SHOOTLESS 3) [Durusdinium trenchii]|uniref:Calpain-type cysteine protease ADL1 (Phytocalpain ADL1) (Protein ADAXIALIZED LEAF1) (Protein DEFECTIVE KERNEL 1) (OsDEK1) (Protein SHOOTLESS 3) n=1 Tax=Durusdinium trenchii TaxID=1381693 RepID=A0ABP0SMI0_9DINO